MTIVKKLRSPMAYRWVLVVCLKLLITPGTLSIPAPSTLVEFFDITEATIPENPEPIPASLTPAAAATSLPYLLSASVSSAASPSASSLSASVEAATFSFSQPNTESPSAPLLPAASANPVSSPAELVEAATSDFAPSKMEESAALEISQAELVIPPSSDSASSLTFLAAKVVLQPDNSESQNTLPTFDKLLDEVQTSLLTTSSRGTETSDNSDAATPQTASVIEEISSLETSTLARAIKSDADSSSTIASSNAPATTTTNENGDLMQIVDAVSIEQKRNEQEPQDSEKEKDIKQGDDSKQHDPQTLENEQQQLFNTQHIVITKISTQQQQMTTATEHQMQQQHTFTTDVPRRQTAKDMHTPESGNTEIVATTAYIVADNTKPVIQAAATSAPAKEFPTTLTDVGNEEEEKRKKSETEIIYESTTFEHFEDTKPSEESDLGIIMKTEDPKKTETQIVIDSLQLQTVTTLSPQEQTKLLSFQDVDKQMTVEDFKPLIQDANRRLLKERTIFTPKRDQEDEQDWKQNLLPNEVEDYDHQNEATKLYSNPYEHNINWSPYLHPATPVVDFTGKVLQEQDGVITEIEQKFRLNEFPTDVGDKATELPTEYSKHAAATTTTTTNSAAGSAGMSPDVSTKSLAKPSISVNHEILQNNDHQNQQHPLHHQTAPLRPSKIAVVRPRLEFIERRVKKSFDFPMHRMASDATHTMQHFDFANTKFSSNINEPMQHLTTGNGGLNAGAGVSVSGATVNQGHDTDAVVHVPRPQPEFSTTKFYNSKELYNEMLQHKSKQLQQLHDKDNTNALNMQHKDEVATPSLALNSFAVLHSPKIAKLEELHELHEPQKSLAIKRVTVQATKHKENPNTDAKDPMATNTISSRSTTTTTATTTTTSTTSTTTTSTAMPPVKKFHKELKKAKLLLKTMLPARQFIEAKTNGMSVEGSASSLSLSYGNKATTPAPSGGLQTPLPPATSSLYTSNPLTLTTVKPLGTLKVESRSNTLTASNSPSSASSLISSSTSATAQTSAGSLKNLYSSSSSTTYSPTVATSRPTPAAVSTNPTKSPLKPIVRPRILSRLQEKINSLECEIQNVPQDSHLWRGNETHELLLPIMTPENCKTDKDCTAMMVSWEGEAEIQSGDILIVEVNDALLNPKDVNLTTSAHNTQVYQVTRSGHEHCDVTEGILLDITPLIVDGRKLVTLYDKDLTEGVNLLIVVSELWGSQCVRLKVTTKTENCGENADCSGKGVCFSNTDMEEYECQCCSGFAGPHCEEIDACTPSPCTNNGICVDLSQGHEGNSYQCLCPYGYTGKNCQYELDPCNPAECMNGGSCVGNSTHFRCECSPGYTGPLCQHSLNECESSPCIHGICVDQEDGFRCFCQPGFAGELCNFEYNECESNPCQNGGECIDHIGSFECHCTKGFTGNRCQIKVDFCANKPCPEGRRCIDHGNDYNCECPGGRNGPDCNEMQRTQCNVNPCTHGGTCWSSGESFYCACRPGYTGTMCEDEFVVETVVSSSEFMVDDTSARNFNDKSFGSSVVLKSPIELHNAYTAAIVLALVLFFVALYLTICHCKVNQTYRKFSTRTYGFLPIIGFRWRSKQATSKISRHWLSGKGLGVGNAMRATSSSGGGIVGGGGGGGGATNSLTSSQRNNSGHLPTANSSSSTHQQHHVGQLNERPFQRHLAMNLENDMYYTVDFSENSQHSPLIQ